MPRDCTQSVKAFLARKVPIFLSLILQNVPIQNFVIFSSINGLFSRNLTPRRIVSLMVLHFLHIDGKGGAQFTNMSNSVLNQVELISMIFNANSENKLFIRLIELLLAGHPVGKRCSLKHFRVQSEIFFLLSVGTYLHL